MEYEGIYDNGGQVGTIFELSRANNILYFSGFIYNAGTSSVTVTLYLSDPVQNKATIQVPANSQLEIQDLPLDKITASAPVYVSLVRFRSNKRENVKPHIVLRAV